MCFVSVVGLLVLLFVVLPFVESPNTYTKIGPAKKKLWVSGGEGESESEELFYN